MSLDDNEVESHVCPCELGELELVVTLLEGADKEDEAWRECQQDLTQAST